MDLFTGIGGLTLALGPWVRPIAYCEADSYCQGVLLSRMRSGELPTAPIWDDVRTLQKPSLEGSIVDIIYGGFPCQDISVAGLGAGLEGKRSGLFFEIMRLVSEINPSFVFLENVPAIRTRGGERVGKELASRGYDCRWGIVSAAEVGAPHLRKRWFLLANANSFDCGHEREKKMPGNRQMDQRKTKSKHDGIPKPLAQSTGERSQKRMGTRGHEPEFTGASDASWWATEPDVGRVANGIPARVDRIRALGNAVVPVQAREAFKRLSGA